MLKSRGEANEAVVMVDADDFSIPYNLREHAPSLDLDPAVQWLGFTCNGAVADRDAASWCSWSAYEANFTNRAISTS
jgi:hypothetical protein